METTPPYYSILVLLGSLVGALILAQIAIWIIRFVKHRKRKDKAERLILSNKWKLPIYVLFPAIAILIALPFTTYEGNVLFVLKRITWIWFISALTFLSMQAVDIAIDYFIGRLNINAKDNLRARQLATQLRVLEQVLLVGILIIGLCGIIMLFDQVRQLGVSLLASAGVIGIIVGFAAQKTIGNLFAGIQLAITQPIRLDDVLIVEGEWGRVEEITLTYVVVKIWDLRRLVVPVSYFIDRPFQNWTKTSSDILGTVFFYVDYTLPVDFIRKKLEEIVQDDPNWDKKVCGVQVTNTNEKGVEVRALVSSVDASQCWDLRCKVREEMLIFLQKEFPDSLPKVRLEPLKPLTP